MFFSKKKKKQVMLLSVSTAIVAQAMIPLVAAEETNTQQPTTQMSLADSIEAEARKYLGLEYVWGGTTPAGFDCSGLMQFVFAKHGIKLPRTAAEQYRVGDHVATSDLQKGDLVFFTTYKPGASHVGIYLGNGKFIDANSSGLMISDFHDDYWQKRYIGAKRIFTESTDGITYNTAISKTTYVPSTQTVFELNDDKQTYTVQRGNSIIEIASHFDVSTEEIVQWNNLESINTPLTAGQKLLIKKPQLALTLFDKKTEVVTEVVQETISSDKKSTADSIKERLRVKVNGEEQKVEEELVVQPIIPIDVTKEDFLPTMQFNIDKNVAELFQTKKLTRAEVAVALYHLEQANPSFNQAFSEKIKSQSLQDVTDDHWAKEAIDWAIQTGLFTANENDLFNPEQSFEEKHANRVMERLLDRYVISESELNFVKEQLTADSTWALHYFQELTFNIADNLVALEKMASAAATSSEEDISTEPTKVTPAMKLASERMTQYLLATKTALTSVK